MKLEILHVPDCLGVRALDERLGPLITSRPDIQVVHQVVTTQEQARQLGMIGSPTILADGTDLFPVPGRQPFLSCRLYAGPDGRLASVPSAVQLRAVLGA